MYLSMYKSIQWCCLKWWTAEKMFFCLLDGFFEKTFLVKTCFLINSRRKILGSDITNVEMRVNMPKKIIFFLKNAENEMTKLWIRLMVTCPHPVSVVTHKEVGHVVQQQSSEALWQQKSFQWTTIL